jgi:hypothetical protein
LTKSKSLLIIALPLLALSLAILPIPVAAYVPHQGDYFRYYEVEDLGNGTGSYAGYTERTVITGTERMTGVGGDGIVSANYNYSYSWNNSTGTTETGSKSGNYTFSSKTFLYVHGTDDQTGYVNPTVWFYMNSSIPKTSTFNLLNTQMTVMSRNYSYYLPSQNRDVTSIFAQGISNYQRNDQHGIFTATYTWNTYFDPSTGYIIGYSYVEHDTNSSGTGFTYTDNLYVTSTSYPLTAAGVSGTSTISITTQSASSTGNPTASNDWTQYIGYIAVAVIIIAVIGILISRRNRRTTLPQHPAEPFRSTPPADIDLTPKQQPPVQQIVIKEVVKVNCRYCGALMDSTAQICPRCGAPRT